MVIIDTNVLMHETRLNDIIQEFSDKEIYIPSEVLSELDNLKTKEGNRGYLARCAIRNIRKHLDKLKFLIHDDVRELNRTNMIVDDIIIEHCKKNPSAVLITNDVNMEIKANALGIKSMNYVGKKVEEPISISKIHMTLEEYEEFTIKNKSKKLNKIKIGQFVQILNPDKNELGVYRFLAKGKWDPIDRNQELSNYAFNVRPWDSYQACAIKSLQDDEFTVITGPAGTGKTLLALGACLEQMHRNGSVIHIFVNPVKTRGAEELGYYPGDRDEKLLSNFIGSLLTSKLGDIDEVHRMLSSGDLRIHPFSDIRGMEIASGDVMYITEAQNLSIDLMKLAIQRCADGSKLIVEGDADTQIDKYCFEGEKNGLKRVIEVFTGTDVCDFGYVHLPVIHRSNMAQKAEEL